MKIVIAGGGTAGWISAYLLANSQVGVHEITVIESSEIGIIGAGEGSTGMFYQLVSDRIVRGGSSVEEFMMRTDSTLKYGIKHEGWSATTKDYFAPLNASDTANAIPDVHFLQTLIQHPFEHISLASTVGLCYYNNKAPLREYAFHFDGHKVGKYFEYLLMKDDNKVKKVDAVINKVNLNQQGEIDSLILSNGQTIQADFFIDCTGFARVLSKELGVKWVSYKENLPADRALPFIVDYKMDGTDKIEQLTKATAMSSGWMWNIPLQTRMGQGYVYSSEFLSEDEAHREIELKLGHSVTPIKTIKFEGGRADNLWVKNCLSTGLAGSFLEPLEATSIHATIIQLLEFIYQCLTPDKQSTLNPASIKMFNSKMNNMFDDYRDFVVLHYQGGREDSEFWRYIKTGKTLTPFVSDLLEHCKDHVPTHLYYENYLGTSAPLWNWILAGLGKLSPEIAKQELQRYGKLEQSAIDYRRYMDYPPFYNNNDWPEFLVNPKNASQSL
jgi:tryptophan halogenase